MISLLRNAVPTREREFTDELAPNQTVAWDAAVCGNDAECDRQVEAFAILNSAMNRLAD
jgi:hypothetical protein